MSVGLNLRVEDRLHATGVERIWLGEVDNAEAVLDISPHVSNLVINKINELIINYYNPT